MLRVEHTNSYEEYLPEIQRFATQNRSPHHGSGYLRDPKARGRTSNLVSLVPTRTLSPRDSIFSSYRYKTDTDART